MSEEKKASKMCPRERKGKKQPEKGKVHLAEGRANENHDG